MPIVEVQGTNHNILCTGLSCANLVDAMRAQVVFDATDYISFDDVVLDNTLFCNELKTKKPAGCGSTPPPSPGLNGLTLSNFRANHTNGCGDGSWAVWIVESIGGQYIDDYNSSDPNRPMLSHPEVSFLDACTDHDVCYASANLKPSCDLAFQSAMISACSVISNPNDNNVCQGFANTYAGIVQVAGSTAYQNAVSARSCALWHHDMDQNECPKT